MGKSGAFLLFWEIAKKSELMIWNIHEMQGFEFGEGLVEFGLVEGEFIEELVRG